MIGYVLMAVWLVTGSGEAAEAPRLAASFSETGLTSLTFGGEEFLANGALRVSRVVLRSWDGVEEAGGMKERSRTFEIASRRLTLVYDWGTVTAKYQPAADRLGIALEVTNTGERVVAGLWLQLMETQFPQPPAGWKPHFPYRAFNLGGPTTLFAQCDRTTLAACNEEVGRPLLFGWAGRESLSKRPLIVGTRSDWMQHLLNPMMDRPLYPGLSDRFELSVRFAPAGTPGEKLVGDLWRRYAEVHPYRLKWEDRRPIGALFLSSSGLKAPFNPRGWFNDKAANFLIESGRQVFRQRLLQHARQSLAVLKEMNCQGMVVWDIEGQEYPHAISYLGDPRSLPAEMEPAADEYFKVFTDAGLRVGVCIRPQRPVRTAYGEGVRQIAVPDVEANLNAKLEYAKKRWGCTLFYIDSNGDPNVPMDAGIFCRLAAKHPDCLLMPEHENPQYYTGTAPYRDFANLKQRGTPAFVRELYPQAFCALYVGHGDPEPVKEQLVEDVRRGDILVIHGWYKPKSHETVKWIYEQAAKDEGE